MKKEYRQNQKWVKNKALNQKAKAKVSVSMVRPKHGVESKGKGKKVSGSSAGPKHGVDSKEKGKEASGSMMEQNQSVGEIITRPLPFDDLPEDCISKIISFTSPRDACVSSLVSKTFESAVQSDSVWDKFLPLDYTSLAPASRAFSSKRELYFSLCDHFLIEDGKKSFWLEKGSGKKCVMLAPRQLWITWGSSPEYWQWITMPESRFEEVAELRNVCAFEMGGSMYTRVLSPRTHYSAYFVYKIRNRRHGLRDLPIQVGVGFKGQDMPKKFICFDVSNDKIKQWPRKELMKSEKREDGWIEAEIGDFFNEEDCDEIQVSIVDITSGNWKCGVIIQGIEFRPKNCR
ncbi:F-box domain-containing protein [Hirschfeldia incana]|nr:F-box domain-containing protein [Hirschfeldia incana]